MDWPGQLRKDTNNFGKNEWFVVRELKLDSWSAQSYWELQAFDII